MNRVSLLEWSKQQPQSSYKDKANRASKDTGEVKLQPIKAPKTHRPKPRRIQAQMNYSRTRHRTRPPQIRDRHNYRVNTPQWHLRQNTPHDSANSHAGNSLEEPLKAQTPWVEGFSYLSQPNNQGATTKVNIMDLSNMLY